MAETTESSSQEVVRVAMPGHLAFQLRKGEEGISVFELTAINPSLTMEEILGHFRLGSQPILRSVTEIVAKGLQIIPVEGTTTLPDRLRHTHREIRPGPGMTREQFKRALKELE
jgi:hypothetical protein